MPKKEYPNRLGKNVKSPKNERELIAAYQERVPSSKKADNMDIAAVRLKNGTRAHGMMNQSANRSHDKEWHRVQNAIPDIDLKKKGK